jgi:hypothetical protein
MGFYKFKNPLLKSYVILRSRADSPENEIAAIDAQIKYRFFGISRGDAIYGGAPIK